MTGGLPDRNARGRRASRLTRRARRTFLALLLAITIAAMDYTIVSAALPTIVGEMGSLTLLPWVLTSNVLASTVTVPLYGKLSDLYGRRRLMQIAILLFCLGSVSAGLSQSIGQLIGFRAIQGAGSAGLISLSYMVVGDLIPPRQRGRYQAYISGVFAVASFCGPLVGGLAVDYVSWRLAFYPSVLLAVIALVVIRRNLVDPPVTRGVKVDWLGAALLALGLSAVLLVASWAGSEHAWGSPVIVSMIVVGVLALLWFVKHEARAPSPILPLFLFRNREFSAANAASFVAGFGLFLPLAYFPVFLQISLGMSATRSGLLLVPMLTASAAGSLVSGRVVARWGKYRLVVTVGCVLLGVGLALLSTMTVSTSPLAAAAYVVVPGLSMGILIPVLVLVIQNSVHPRDLGVATSSVQVCRQLGGSTGVAVFGALFNGHLGRTLAARLPPGSPMSDLDVSELIGSPAVVAAMEPGLRDIIREAVSVSSGQMYRMAIPVAVGATIAGLMLRGLPLRDGMPDRQPCPSRSSEEVRAEPTQPSPGEPS